MVLLMLKGTTPQDPMPRQRTTGTKDCQERLPGMSLFKLVVQCRVVRPKHIYTNNKTGAVSCIYIYL